MKFTQLLLLLVLIAGNATSLFSQNYDVLPSDNRQELFHDYLLEEFDEIITQRKADVETSLASEEDVKTRIAGMRTNYLEIIGDLPEKTPLNAKVVKTITNTDGYKIENVVYESVPNHHVTANFYIPTTGDGPFPAVIILCGHYPIAKTYVDYQNLSILFAKNGIAALIVDPICQGERYQITNSTGKLSFLSESGTKQHSRLDVGSVLNGSSVVAYQLWDNYRGVDYLHSRTDVVDTTRIGCSGHSGGGAQATYLLAYDTRLKIGTVANYLTNETSMFKETGPQTASQNLSYEGEKGIDAPDYVELFAPKPYMLIGTSTDFFILDAMRETYEEAKKVYGKFSAVDKVALFETDDVHDYTTVKREATVRWYKRWLLNNNDTVIEADQTPLDKAELTVTESGQVMTEYENEKNITALDVAIAESHSAAREAFWTDNTKDVCLNKVKDLMRYTPLTSDAQYEAVEDIERKTYKIEKGKITYANHVPVTTLTFVPSDNTAKLPAILYVDGRGKATDAEDFGLIEQVYVDSGYLVMSVDVRGFGETADNTASNKSKHNNKEHRNSVISLYIGKTLVGQRVEDIEKALDILLARSDVDASKVTIVGVDRASVAVLHAAAIDERITNVVIRKADETPWMDVIADPTIKDQMTHQIPSAMKYYDINGLIENGIAPREVVFAEEPEIETEKPNNISSIGKNNVDFQNFPNPFSDLSVVKFNLEKRSEVSFEIFSTDGKVVKSIKSLESSGTCQYTINASDFKPGIYFYNLRINNSSVATCKMIITK